MTAMLEPASVRLNTTVFQPRYHHVSLTMVIFRPEWQKIGLRVASPTKETTNRRNWGKVSADTGL